MLKLIFLIAASLIFTSTVPVYGNTLRDPTTPLSYSPVRAGKPKLQLQAIYYGSTRKEAIVNGQLVKEGSQVAGVEITRISSNKVYYKQGAQTGALVLLPKVSKATQ